MPTPEEDVQAAVDRGELQARTTPQIKRAIEQTERRWILMQAKEIAVAWNSMTVKDFRDLCEFMREFTIPPPAA